MDGTGVAFPKERREFTPLCELQKIKYHEIQGYLSFTMHVKVN